ncbi:MAG: hypothetical protein JWQ81_8533 [Amycolatopsis sp.]|uniref:hypothetical protein n=1 Tax=Amycolatopsis sp. TaxID=37632 RepID=UPI0026186669|nr:hypothetical protein [Amycolatopsis sp.]MCU1687794.1 hypothetical protein [Amycolatopsis sp.]
MTSPEQIRTNLTVAIAELTAVRGQLTSAVETIGGALARVRESFEGSTQREYVWAHECLVQGHDEILMANDNLAGSINGIETLMARL